MMAFAANKDYENKIIELCYLNILLLALKVKRKCLLSFIIYIYMYMYIWEEFYNVCLVVQNSVFYRAKIIFGRKTSLYTDVIINLN